MKYHIFVPMRVSIALFSLIIVLMSSCISNKRYARFVYPKIKGDYSTTKKVVNWVEFKTDSLIFPDTLVRLTTLKAQFIPALLFYRTHKTINVEINPVVPLHAFQQSLYTYANVTGLIEKLGNRKLRLSVNQIPNGYIFVHEENIVFLVLGYWYGFHKAIIPHPKDLKVGYELLNQDGVVEKSGVIIIKNTDEPIKARITDKTKPFTWHYLNQYGLNCSMMFESFNKELMVRLF